MWPFISHIMSLIRMFFLKNNNQLYIQYRNNVKINFLLVTEIHIVLLHYFREDRRGSGKIKCCFSTITGILIGLEITQTAKPASQTSSNSSSTTISSTETNHPTLNHINNVTLYAGNHLTPYPRLKMDCEPYSSHSRHTKPHSRWG